MKQNIALTEIEERLKTLDLTIEEYSTYKNFSIQDIIACVALSTHLIVTVATPSLIKIIWLIILSLLNYKTIIEKTEAYLLLPIYKNEKKRLKILKKQKKNCLKEKIKKDPQLETIMEHLSNLSKEDLVIAEMVIKEYAKGEEPAQKISNVASILTQAECGLEPDEIKLPARQYALKK